MRATVLAVLVLAFLGAGCSGGGRIAPPASSRPIFDPTPTAVFSDPFPIATSEPPGGREVTLPDGNVVFASCVGDGDAIVLIEGNAGPWGFIRDRMLQDKRATFCTYNHLGEGRSVDEPVATGALDLIETTRAVVEHVGQGDPVVIAAWGESAYAARLFASYYPHLVAGVVFVDPTHEGEQNLVGTSGAETNPFTYAGVSEDDLRAALADAPQFPAVPISVAVPSGEPFPGGPTPAPDDLIRLQARSAVQLSLVNLSPQSGSYRVVGSLSLSYGTTQALSSVLTAVRLAAHAVPTSTAAP